MSKFIRIAGAAFALSLSLAAAPAFAADPVAVVDLQRVYAESAAGKSAQAQLKAISETVQKELDPEAKALQSEKEATWAPKFNGKTDQQASAELEKDQALKTKYMTYVQRTNALLQKGELRRGEMQATEQSAVQAVLQAAAPDVKASMTAKGASVVLEKGSVVTAADAVDITTDVLSRFNARVKTVPVSKVDLTQQQK
jgi:Skp family chaperone for outer membrane proteins